MIFINPEVIEMSAKPLTLPQTPSGIHVYQGKNHYPRIYLDSFQPVCRTATYYRNPI